MPDRIAVNALLDYPFIPCLFVEDMCATMYLCGPSELRNNDIIITKDQVTELFNTRGRFPRNHGKSRIRYYRNIVFEHQNFPGIMPIGPSSNYIRVYSSTLFHFVWYKNEARTVKFVSTNRNDIVQTNEITMPLCLFESTGNQVNSFFDLNTYIIHSAYGYYSNIQFTNMNVIDANEINLIQRLQEA